jgi:hypothetical protein
MPSLAISARLSPVIRGPRPQRIIRAANCWKQASRLHDYAAKYANKLQKVAEE